MYVLDTNTLIYFFKDMGNVKHNLLQISPQDLAIPSVVVYELEYGLANQGILVTRNTGEFSRVAGLDLEDWY